MSLTRAWLSALWQLRWACVAYFVVVFVAVEVAR